MKATELRIGNYVHYIPKDNEDMECYVCKVDGEDIHKMEQSEEYANEHKPIPLTTGWLAELHDKTNRRIKNVYIVDRFMLIWKPSYKYWYVVDSVNNTYITKVVYVHEWQNVFYVLNRKELEIKK